MRLDVHFTAQVSAGALAGARVRGIDYLLLRADGLGVINAYETIHAGEGQVASAHARGYIVPPNGVDFPRPDVLLSPDFAWPDLPLPQHGFALYRTGAPGLAHPHPVAASFAGHVNVGRGQLVVKARELRASSDPVAA